MLINRIASTIFLVLLLPFLACQTTTTTETESAEKLFINYYARYLQNDRLFRAEADFLIGDSIQVAQPTTMPIVRFQGGTMPLKELPERAARYKTERSGNFQSKIQFKYENEQGVEQVNDFQLDPVESFLFKDDISQSKGFTIVWKGSPLQQGEKLLLLFGDKNNKAASTEILGPTQRSESTLEGAFLKDLQTGPGVLLLVRSKEGKITEEKQVINYELSYYSSPQDIRIKK